MPKRNSKVNGAPGKKVQKPTKNGKPAVEVAKKAENKSEKEATTSTAKGASKMTLSSTPVAGIRGQYRERRPGRPPSGKRLAATKEMPGKIRAAYRRSLVDPCDNSNDSGLGFDHHMDARQHSIGLNERLSWSSERSDVKRPRLIKLEHDDVNDGYSFPDNVRNSKDSYTSLIRTIPSGNVPPLSTSSNQHNSSGRPVPRCIPISNRTPPSQPIPLTTQLTSTSRYADVSLTIVKQPEQQHRARYQTEGSRGAVKDREGNGFPIVQLNGYYKPTTLQVFIGTDVGKVSPHMFYQACKVSGKNSTPCIEKKIDGTCVIELQLDPSKDMSATCDCVGILKERNVDVEHRFPDQLGNRSKKKSTRCRMIFRTTITLDDGTQETLQVGSNPIVCTQPPGVPEICKKSLTSCPASGGLELFVLGKNFLKDTKVFFQEFTDERLIRWEQSVTPDKEYLQQTHFVCVVPPYRRPDITEPVTVRLCVVSSGKTSESQPFMYTPVNGAMPSVHVEQPAQRTFFNKMLWPSAISKREQQDLGMMPPPESSLVPLSTRRSSISVPSTSEVHSPPLHCLKQEYIDENSQGSMIDAQEIGRERYRHISESSMDVQHGDSNMSMINENSIDMIRRNSLSNPDLMNGDNSNLSVNENSVEMIVRRNSMSGRPMRSICDNSVESANLAVIDQNLMHSTNSIVTDKVVLAQSAVHQQTMLSTMVHHQQQQPTAEELKVMDLRMKLPMGTVADLANTNTPSMQTLQRFAVTEGLSGPLPAQTAQSVANFLTDIETKPTNTIKDQIEQKLLSTQVMPGQTCSNLLPTTTENFSQLGIARSIQEPIFMNNQKTFLNPNNPTKIEVEENLLIPPTPINTEKLDALVNSTVESHMKERSESIQSKMGLENQQIINNQDVMMNPMIPPTINTRMASPTLVQNEINASHISPNLSSEVILNSQISPSLMCCTTQEALLPASNLNALCPDSTQPINQQQILLSSPTQNSPNSLHSPIQNPLIDDKVTLIQAQDAVILEATADLLQTQKKLSALDNAAHIGGMNMITMTPTIMQETANGFMNGQQAATESTMANANMLMSTAASEAAIIPEPVKEMAAAASAQNDKKNEDKMIPQSFTSLSENELINFINPSCFDQGNNNYQ